MIRVFFIAAEAIARTMAGTGAKDVQKIQHANKEIKNKLSFCCGLVVDLNIHSLENIWALRISEMQLFISFVKYLSFFGIIYERI